MGSLTAADIAEIAAWRHDFHRHPELLYDVPRTAGRVAALLRGFGFDEVVEGVGRSGVVGILKGDGGGPARLFRADMDALPIDERAPVAYRSTIPGRMHACGHDGHTAMLLGAAKRLAASRAFKGTLVFAFQPAEEGGAGALAMIEDGVLERWKVESCFGIHIMPGVALDTMAIANGPVLAASDRFEIKIDGVGGHAATPHLARDPIAAGVAIASALQSAPHRVVAPLEPFVLTVSRFRAGEALNVIPPNAELGGLIRCFDPATREILRDLVRGLPAKIAATYGTAARTDIAPGYPATINDPAAAAVARSAAGTAVGAGNVRADLPRRMESDDFAYFAEKRPSAFAFLGNGDTPHCHNPAFVFDDGAISPGVRYWLALAQATAH
jgi:amidohydrolase